MVVAGAVTVALVIMHDRYVIDFRGAVKGFDGGRAFDERKVQAQRIRSA